MKSTLDKQCSKALNQEKAGEIIMDINSPIIIDVFADYTNNDGFTTLNPSYLTTNRKISLY